MAPPEEIAAALREAGLRDADVSTRRRAEYSTDASLYRVVPSVVAFPRAADEVVAALEVCRALGVPLTARGAGTSIAGNAVGEGVVLDFSRHLGRIRGVDPGSGTAEVEPGVVLDDLQRAAAPHGLRFGPDPSTHSRCTIGGMIGNNACGSRALGFGRTSDNVTALDVLAGTGERLTLRHGADAGSSPVLTALHQVVAAGLATIRTELGRFGRQISGYSLEHLLPERGFDPARAFVGSEGTWGVLLGATVKLVPVPERPVLVVLGYPDMAAAADAVVRVLPYRPIAAEGLDSRIVDVVRRLRGPAAVPELPRGGGWLFVELPGEVPASLVADADALGHRIVTDPAEVATLWRIREDGAGLAARPKGGHLAHAGWEDAAVPPERLGDYLRDFETLMAGRGLSGIPYGHFGDGCVHVRIDFPLNRPDGTRVFRDFLTDAAELVAGYGGSMSGEHGDGRARSELLPIMYSDAALRLFEEVKGVFDPDDVLNPGVVVRPRPVDADLRVPAASPLRRGLAFAYDDDAGDFAAAVHRCTGVGKCRADLTGSGGVMCPSYLATRDEKDSTRGRARVLQEMANGSLVKGWRSQEVHEVLDLCLACKGCSSDCPTGVDMATYKAEVLYQSYRRRLRPMSHYVLGGLPRWSRLASRAPRLANRLLSSPLAGPGKRLAGVDARRDLPSFAPRTFRQWFRGHPAAAGDPVLLWVDTFTDHFTPQVGIAAVQVLEDAGFSVRIPERRLCCGLTYISTGRLDVARRLLGRSVDALTPYAEAGVPIVGLEPSCTAVFRSDAPELLGIPGEAAFGAPRRGPDQPLAVDTGEPDPAPAHRGPGADADDLLRRSPGSGGGTPERVPGGRGTARRPFVPLVRTLAELLSQRPGWTPPSLDGVTAVAQPHCHHHAVMGWEADRALLERAGATVEAVGGCCGLAGNFGAERGHYDVSVAVAETALLPAVRAAGADATVLADGFSCRTQLAALADRTGVHLAELLAARGRTDG
ncbi:FAD/FMN-containing dehydrogenase [Thermomonospora echinospora]|uniref:FAD/FMN-containing dehydrogenase n=1 Tax=Thermomonospora echinospora TaxID=1992 RepID=A0A1H6DK78_9ACTN|nr:FAD-binding and (Fe-S)-binding domain-containing protein [Thermomonospora echinospora]SEG85678.1 FAD/FMN-containing dehydrogenase [Thermomonospora echinospora]